jgi:hypothetical protein
MRMLTRRSFLRGVAATAPALWLATSATACVGRRRGDGLPLDVVNRTGRFASSDILVYIVGNDPATGTQAYADGDGRLRPVTVDLNGEDGYADIGIPLTGDTTPLSLPKMSGRIYVAIGSPLRIRVVTDGNGRPALQYPAGWVDGDPNFGILHDCAEFTYNDAGMFCNTTMVDMLSVPLAITLRGAADQTTGTLAEGGRSRIFAQVASAPGFDRLVIDDLRVIAPGHGLDAGRFSATYFDGYIDEVWSRYSATDLRVTTNGTTRRGRVEGGVLRVDGIAPINRPSTRDVLFCDGALAAPNDGVTGPVAAVLGAGFNRSVLRDDPDQPTADRSRYYQGPVTNWYSKAMHDHTADGRAYGFAFDDVLDQASYIQDHAPTSITLSLTPFG